MTCCEYGWPDDYREEVIRELALPDTPAVGTTVVKAIALMRLHCAKAMVAKIRHEPLQERSESMSSIGRCIDRASSSIFPHLAVTGGIRPPDRERSRLALSLIEREVISRGIAAKRSLRAIARILKRSDV